MDWCMIATTEREDNGQKRKIYFKKMSKDRRGCDRMAVGFTVNYTISAYYLKGCEFESRSWRWVLDTT